jgi:hypothetical protein
MPGPRRKRRRKPVDPWIEALPDLPVKTMRELLGERDFQAWERCNDEFNRWRTSEIILQAAAPLPAGRRADRMIPMTPLALSDAEMEALLAAARPLSRERRDAFLRAVAADLGRAPERGPGVLHRIIRAVQRQFFDPPADGGLARAPKYDRDR